ncbi:MAG: hypothetical protein HZT40_12115 [Candidatus Thiothrix singaporensis]|uniref:Uncharacterized protein n=1 Tax=Candidatus Thiothrix singaporensis TaxID=2799669 RepID=A0A7L6ATE3_9GAMM|nr:MAG: hypothetical protein HZT40_12115 [Candidatus Thiothrix singaporensis]
MADIEANDIQELRMSNPGNNIVRVSVPASAYFKLDAMQKIQKDILGRLGCLACCSGWDIRFDLQRQFIVDERLNVREFG